MEKVFVKNRKGQRLAVILENTSGSELVFIVHGLGGFKEQPQIERFAKAFQNANYTVIRWDAANTIGESEGRMEDATLTNYYEDFEDILLWAQTKDWYKEPFVLCGHSLGGGVVINFAQQFPKKVKALAPFSTVVTGKLTLDEMDENVVSEWKKTSYRFEESGSKPGVIKKIAWAEMEDRLRYDFLKDAGKLTMPILLMVGSNDATTPPRHQKLLYDAFTTKNKTLEIIDGAEHTFKSEKELEEVYEILRIWIKKL